jgi:phytoene dehydrogenase-like protein
MINFEENVFDHASRKSKAPAVILPLPDGKMIDVWTFLAALFEVLDNDDAQTAQEMVEWLGNVIYEGMEAVADTKPKKKNNIAQIYRKETENFDERFEQFLRELEEETDKPE